MTSTLRNTKIVGRLAPSPSGKMHLGNAFTYILAWASVRKASGHLIFRMEDIDERCKRPELKEACIFDMRWLGLDWDGDVVYQSKRSHIYKELFAELKNHNLVYPCFCSRADLHVATAPHTTDGTYIYSGKCRRLSKAQIDEKMKVRHPSYRIKTSDVTISVTDAVCGEYSQNLTKDCGDFVVLRSDLIPAYQFAVTTDDYLQGINQIVRGNDLLSSTPRQLFLRDVINFVTTENEPYSSDIKRINTLANNLQFTHVPLLTDEYGRRLAKRDKDLTIEALRANGISANDIIGYFAYILKFIDEPEQVSLEEFLDLFDISIIDNQNIAVDYEKLIH